MSLLLTPEETKAMDAALLPEDISDMPDIMVLTSLWEMNIGEVAETTPLFAQLSAEAMLLQCTGHQTPTKKAPSKTFRLSYYGVRLKTFTLTRSKGQFTWN